MLAIALSSALTIASEAMASDDILTQSASVDLDVQRALASKERGALPSPEQLVRVAVYNLETENLPVGFGKIITDSLLAEVRKIEGISAIGMDEITAMISLEAQKQMMGCDETDSCLAEIAGALGVDEILTGRISELASGRNIALKRVSQTQARVLTSFDERLQPNDGEEFLAAIGPAVKDLFPARKILPGFERGVSAEVARRLNPPPIDKWASLTTASAALVAASIAGVGYRQTLSIQSRYDERLARDQATFADSGHLASPSLYSADEAALDKWGTTVNISLGSAGALALSAVIMALWTDWEGHADE